MEIEDYMLKAQGFIDGRLWFEEKLRRATGLLQLPHITKQAPSIMDQWPMQNDEKNKKLAKEYVDEKNLEVMNMHKQGGFEYVLENGRIVMKKINLN